MAYVYADDSRVCFLVLYEGIEPPMEIDGLTLQGSMLDLLLTFRYACSVREMANIFGVGEQAINAYYRAESRPRLFPTPWLELFRRYSFLRKRSVIPLERG